MRLSGKSLFLPLAVLALFLSPRPSAAEPGGGFLALSGAAAASFVLPGDVQPVKRFQLDAYGLTYERYQQYVGPAQVLGGQLTLYRSDSGTIVTVIGAHFPGLSPRNNARLSAAEATNIAERDLGQPAAPQVGPPTDGERLLVHPERHVDLLIHPESGRLFFRVESRNFDSRWFHWIDAENGQVLNKYDAIATDNGFGTGVKGDTKDLDGPDTSDGGGPGYSAGENVSDDLTTYHNASGHGFSGSHWDLFSKDNRQKTYDKRNKNDPFIYYVTDGDNHWTLVTGDRTSPGHPALIDAQYYANVTDDYYQSRHGFNWLGCGYSAMQSVAHYGTNYNNAFWNGTYTVYGDGDGSVFRELSGGLDVVAHEHTHGVTDCTSNLVYQDESGALNEAFSDILGNSAEFYAAANGLDPSVGADWWIGEDVYLPPDTVPGFRNMADPREDGDPDHYSERQIGGGDNGGVHTNSGIPNHAYFLLVNGGKNAGCDAVGSGGHTHTADCGVTVAGIGLLKAERIFFLAFIGLPLDATMSNARDATVAVASSPPYTAGDCASVVNAWQAVGVAGSATCGGAPPPAAPTNLTAVDHPADNGGAIDMGWTPSVSGGITEQRLYRATTSGGPYSLVATFPNNTTNSYTDSGLVNGTVYYYVIRAYNGTQESANSNQNSAAPVDNLSPAAPTGLSALDQPADNGAAIDLSWTPSASTDVTQQRLYRATATGGPYTQIATFNNNTTNSYPDSGLVNGTTYYYVVRAFDGTQESANSNQASAAPVDNIAPAAPTGLGAVDHPADNGGAIDLSWAPSISTDVTQQRIYRGTSSGVYGASPIATLGSAATSYTDSAGLTNGTTYYYVARAYDGTSLSPNSTEASSIPLDNLAPEAPTNLTAADKPNDGGGAINLIWTKSASTDVTEQRIFRRTEGGVYGAPIASVGSAATSYTDTGLTNGTTYYYVVRAYDGTQESPNSNEASAAPVDNPPEAPAGLTATAGNAQVSLDWSNNTEPDLASYKVYRSTNGAGPYGWIATVLVPASAYMDTGLTNGTPYYYVVSALDTGGNESVYSSQAAATPQAPAAGVSVTGIAPSSMARATSVNVTISGTGFQGGATVSFQNGKGPTPSLSSVVVVNATTITATVTTKSGGPPGSQVWDVRVTNPDSSSGVLVGGFTVTP